MSARNVGTYLALAALAAAGFGAMRLAQPSASASPGEAASRTLAAASGSAEQAPKAKPAPKPQPKPPKDSEPEPTPVRYVVAAIGDSLTDERSYPHAYMAQLRQACPKSRWDNYGVGGNMVNQMRRRFDAAVLAKGKPKYTHLLVFGGVNDIYSDKTAGRTPEKISRDLSYMYERATARGVRVVGLTVAPWAGFKKWYNPSRAKATAEVNRFILEQAESGAISSAIDAYSLLSCGDPEHLCKDYTPPFKDGLHFGKAGHARLVSELRSQVFQHCE